MPLLQRKLKLTFCWIRIFSLSNSSFFFCVKTVSLILNHLRFSSSSAKRWLLRTNSPCSDFNSSVKSWYFAWYTWISLFTVIETKESHTRKSTAVLHVFGLKLIRVFELLSLSRKKKVKYEQKCFDLILGCLPDVSGPCPSSVEIQVCQNRFKVSPWITCKN